MGKLTFKYGVMGAAKTAEALICKHRYETLGQKVLLLKPRLAVRDGEKYIKSRIGLCEEAEILEDFLSEPLCERMIKVSTYSLVIVDEVQFASKTCIDLLSDIVDEVGTNVCCYGLKTDYKGELFEGSKRLLEIADSIREIDTVCKCGKKATMNVKISNDKDDRKAKYISVCRKCFKKY